MSRFAGVIEAARRGDTPAEAVPNAHEAVNTEARESMTPGSGEPVNKGSSPAMNMGKGEPVFTVTAEHVLTHNGEAMNTVTLEPVQTSNLTITIPTAHRRYWVGEARKRGITVTAVIVEALTARLGRPDQ